MLRAIGASEEELFSGVHASNPRLFESRTEQEILADLSSLIAPCDAVQAGLGIGNHFIPPVVDSLASRGEFVTAYTPYQPECSQGTLQAVFEFQTRVCELTGLDISNAGLYDGSTALVEAVMMALNETGRSSVAVARTVSPKTREVLTTHLSGRKDIRIVEIDFDRAGGRIGPIECGDDTAAVVIQSPNVFGVIEREIGAAFAAAKSAGAIPIQIFHPLAVAIFPKPAEVGASIAVAEGQPLGIPLSGGGPYLGLIAATDRFLRRMPGRIVGKTKDADGREAYTLTLQTREQHIRRERATSNICTNQALMALRATIYLAALGDDGFRSEALRVHTKAERASRGKRVFTGEIFNEWVEANENGLRLEYSELGRVSLHGIAS